MKPSYTQAPRQMSDAVFYTNADPIEKFQSRRTHWLEVVAAVAVFAGIGVLLAWRG